MFKTLEFKCNINQISKIVDQIMEIDWQFLLLSGELGAGKTTLVKKIAERLNINETVNSPTFNLMKIYSNLVHIDAYKLKGTLEEFEDYFDNKKVIVEWAENISFNNYAKKLKIEIFFSDNFDERIYKITNLN
ncbi:tRNA (adenosine(37)-N6)-threonylcarbamoyltransferase complex ATPase subunit type 1 TsaE [[Mycoplasma] collis]|uniref:tRNA (adenosine(37)-N6)-threonylcarbamoyltransferase complex ATPase subunit type 1 TsaE n=1 Tax=[Mycoplasma] collis TaxID=2127 RepID=UPI00051AEE0D|nr:tRNA (adenosine(37)-N6)-threonylcarbamoyltransferase complex ATPase subunit type 1 TsaE [[Mycoplasma] collis]